MDYLREQLLNLKALEREDSLREAALVFADSINYLQNKILVRTNNSLTTCKANEADLKVSIVNFEDILRKNKEIENKRTLKTIFGVGGGTLASFGLGLLIGFIAAR